MSARRPTGPIHPFTLATQTFPTIQAPYPHFARPGPPSLTPPYHPDELKSDCSWSAHSSQRGSDETYPMSRLPAGGSRSGQTTPLPSPIHSHTDMQPPHRGSPRGGPVYPTVSLPPFRHLSTTPPSGRRHADPFRSILNSQAELAEQQRGRRRSASQMDSPSPVDTQHSHSLQSISRPTSVESTPGELQPSQAFQPPGRPKVRHLLGQKSPKLHRTQSLNLLNPPTGTIDAHQTPFLTANARPSEQLTLHSSALIPPVGARPAYFSAVSATVPTPPPHMVRMEMRRPSMGFPQSGSASPIAQYSPYSQPASVASSQYEQPNTPEQYMLSHSNIQMLDARFPRGNLDTERNMIPMAPSGQSSIQLMTIKSQQGHNVQIPVDVQAASKVADEKRRRNAGASARFRARRKEKEREASMSISRLEQQLRNALEDAEYYRGERDYFKAIVFQQPSPERHYGRPPSPRLRRASLPSLPPSTRGGSVDSYADYEDEYREEERNVRRRTSNYQPVSGPPPTESHVLGPDPQSFSTSTFPSANPPATQSTNKNQQTTPHEQSHPTTLQHPHPERPNYRDHFASDVGRYESRGWAPSQQQGA